MIHLLRPFDLFRRHVMRRAHDVLRAGQPEISLPENFCQTKIRNLHTAFFIEQNIFRLDVAVNDAFVMRELECGADLRNDFHGLARRELPGLPQVRPVHKFHDEITECRSVGHPA